MKCLFSVLLSPRDLFPFSSPACCASINTLSTSLAHLMYFLTCSPSLLFPLTCCSLLRLRPSDLCLKLFLRMLESPLLPSSVYPVLDCIICMKVTWIRLVLNSSKLLTCYGFMIPNSTSLDNFWSCVFPVLGLATHHIFISKATTLKLASLLCTALFFFSR